jgi:hypothetical protein
MPLPISCLVMVTAWRCWGAAGSIAAAGRSNAEPPAARQAGRAKRDSIADTAMVIKEQEDVQP